MDEEKKDTVEPKPRWEFDADVAASFADMLERSIPGYATMRELCFEVGSYFVERSRGSTIVDAGSSRGEAVDPFVRRFGSYNRFELLEASKPMLAALRARFDGYIDADVVRVKEWDLRNGLPVGAPASLVLSVLTAMFTPIDYRYHLARSFFERLEPGGAVIFVEKILPRPRSGELLRDLHHAWKEKQGYTHEDVVRKAASLEGVLVPLTSAANKALLNEAGFADVECFWRHLNFGAWVGVKP